MLEFSHKKLWGDFPMSRTKGAKDGKPRDERSDKGGKHKVGRIGNIDIFVANNPKPQNGKNNTQRINVGTGKIAMILSNTPKGRA
jgi:hypothetical protein